MIVHLWKESHDRKTLWQESRDKTARTGKLWQESRDKTARTGKLWQYSRRDMYSDKYFLRASSKIKYR
jgi:hypothetical protein